MKTKDEVWADEGKAKPFSVKLRGHCDFVIISLPLSFPLSSFLSLSIFLFVSVSVSFLLSSKSHFRCSLEVVLVVEIQEKDDGVKKEQGSWAWKND